MKSIWMNLKFLNLALVVAVVGGVLFALTGGFGAGFGIFGWPFLVFAVALPISCVWATVNCVLYVRKSLIREHPVACGFTILQAVIFAAGLLKLIAYLLFELAVRL